MLRIDNAQNRQKQSRKNKVGPHLSWGRLLILVRIWISGCLLILVRIWISGCLLTLVRIWISGCFFFLVRILVGLMDVFQFESQFGICWDTHRYWHALRMAYAARRSFDCCWMYVMCALRRTPGLALCAEHVIACVILVAN